MPPPERKRRPEVGGGADLFGTDRHRVIKDLAGAPRDISQYQALYLVTLGIRPELATTLAGLAFGGTGHG